MEATQTTITFPHDEGTEYYGNGTAYNEDGELLFFGEWKNNKPQTTD